MTDIVFVDVETTGLNPRVHTITEVALIKGEDVVDVWINLNDDELSAADAGALKVNHYWEKAADPPCDRTVRHEEEWTPSEGYSDARSKLAKEIAQLTDRCILAGNAVKFDQQFLEAWLRKHGACPTWDYHVLDVPTFAAGVMVERGVVVDPPFKSSKVSLELLIDEPKDKHTALADAKWSKQMWEKANVHSS